MFVLSLTLLAAGTALAAEVPHRPARRRAFEALAAGLVVGGLCLLGIGLPVFR